MLYRFNLKESWPHIMVTFAACLAVLPKNGPSILRDELGYLSAAHHRSGDGGIFMGGGTRYHPGVSILYALPRTFTDTTSWVYSLSLMVNSLLVGLSSILLTLWLRIQSNSAIPSWLVAVTVLFGGSTIYYASFSMSETAVIGYFSRFLFIAVTIVNVAAVLSQSWRTACEN